jgi:hypothetical protein
MCGWGFETHYQLNDDSTPEKPATDASARKKPTNWSAQLSVG